MGLLDDAIKEHLELKRRHGADPGEVARLEHEALGPARRDPAPAAVDKPVAAEPARADDDLYLDDGGDRDEVTAEERLEAPIHHAIPSPSGSPSRGRNRSRRRGTAGARAGAPGRDRAAHAPVLAGGGRGRHGPAEGTRGARRPRRGPRRRRPRTSSPPTTSPTARTCSRRRRSSCRRRPSTTGSGSSRSLRATSTSSGQAPDVARRLHVAAAHRQRPRRRPPRRRHRRRDDARVRA